MAHLSYCLSSVSALTSTPKEISGMTFMRCLLQQRWRAAKRRQPCTPSFPFHLLQLWSHHLHWCVLFSNPSMHEMEANTFTAAASSLLSQSSKRISSLAYLISCVLTVPRNALLVLLWADGTQRIPTHSRHDSQAWGWVPPGPWWTHTQIPPQDWMHFRTRFKIILPITVCSTKFSRNGWLNNCAHMYTVNPDLFYLATQ